MDSIEKNTIKKLIKEVLKEERKEKMKEEKKYEILRLGNLALGYKTFLGREAMEDEIEIYEYDNTFSWRWTIASFEIREDKTIEIKSCGDRLKNIEDWNAFGQLVKEGYRILENLI